jgi:hypothetical protein
VEANSALLVEFTPVFSALVYDVSVLVVFLRQGTARWEWCMLFVTAHSQHGTLEELRLPSHLNLHFIRKYKIIVDLKFSRF